MKEAELRVGDRVYRVRVRMPDEYHANPQNTNRGKERGDAALRRSLSATGLHRGIVVAGNGAIVAGNHAYQAANEEGVGEAWIEVESDGTVGVVTRRVDWQDEQTPQAIQAAIFDNRVQELNYDPDPEMFALGLELLADAGLGMDRVFFTEDELGELLNPSVGADDDEEDEDGGGSGVDGDRHPLPIVLDWTEKKRWDAMKQKLGIKTDKRAFLEMLERMEEML